MNLRAILWNHLIQKPWFNFICEIVHYHNYHTVKIKILCDRMLTIYSCKVKQLSIRVLMLPDSYKSLGLCCCLNQLSLFFAFFSLFLSLSFLLPLSLLLSFFSLFSLSRSSSISYFLSFFTIYYSFFSFILSLFSSQYPLYSLVFYLSSKSNK